MNIGKFAIVGCGLIGKKRAFALKGHPAASSLAQLYDVDPRRAQALANELQTPQPKIASSFDEILESPEIQTVMIATSNESLAPLTLKAVARGKHVLVEKPGALRSTQLEEIEGVASRTGSLVRLGYNHRYHPALQKARDLIDQGKLGPLMFLRARYGHGARKGYDREWRADPALSGGGELIDQGVHLIDLSSWFLGDFTQVQGKAYTYFWDMPVDDNAFLHLETSSRQTAWLHVSCTEWKNTFSLELYGRDGKIHIEGLGGSYGVEKLSFYQMLPQMGPPDTTVYEYPRGDESWKLEMQEFFEDIELKRTPQPGLREGVRALKIVEEIYRQSGYDFSRSSPKGDLK